MLDKGSSLHDFIIAVDQGALGLLILNDPTVVLSLADVLLGEHQGAETLLRECVNVVLAALNVLVVSRITLLKKLFNDRVSSLTVKFNVASLLVLHDHGHSLTCAVELEHLEDLEALIVTSNIFDHKDAVWLTAYEFKTLVFGAFD